jgi:hypothetical protein
VTDMMAFFTKNDSHINLIYIYKIYIHMTTPNRNDFYDYLIQQEHITSDDLDEDDNDILMTGLDNYVSFHLDYNENETIVKDFGILEAMQASLDEFEDYEMRFNDDENSVINKRKTYNHLSYSIFYHIGATQYDNAYHYMKAHEDKVSTVVDTDEDTDELTEFNRPFDMTHLMNAISVSN